MPINQYDAVADLYDIYVPATFDIPFFLEEAQKVSGEILELMAGTGRVSLPLLEAGARLACVDNSADMLAVLAKKLAAKMLSADLYCQDVCRLDLPRQFASVIIPFHSFAHIVSVEDQKEAFRRIHRHLLPGGSFICTLGNPAVRRVPVDGRLRLFRKYSLSDGQGALLLWLSESFSPTDDHVVETLEFFEEYAVDGTMRSKRLMELHFRLTSRTEFENLARSAGFAISAFYGDYTRAEFQADTSPYMIWIMTAL